MPSFQLRFGTEHLDWPELCRVFELAPLGTREPEKMRRAAENSYLVCAAYSGDSIIGFGRAISDGECQSAIYDIVVLQEYHGQGVGKSIVEGLLAGLPEGPVLIYVVPGKERFYRKMGFKKLLTGMGKFPDKHRAKERGYVP